MSYGIHRAYYVDCLYHHCSKVPIGFAINEFDCVLVGYLTDSYTTFASSAYASLSLLRSIASAVFPLFAHQLYTAQGANYASTILAAVATLACVSPILLIKYGKRLRHASKFARYNLEVGNEESSAGTGMNGRVEDAAGVVSEQGFVTPPVNHVFGPLT